MNIPGRGLLIAICCCVFCFVSTKATHNRGGHISYKRIPPFTEVSGAGTVAAYNYSITVIKYNNSGPGIANRCVDTVFFGDGSTGIAARVNGPVCSDCGPSIGCGSPIAAPYSGIVSIYTVEHKYAGAGTYLIRSTDPNRSDDIENIPNSVNQPFYLESLLRIDSLTNDNSAQITSIDLGKANLWLCFTHSVLAQESDGDSLSYELTANRGYGGSPVIGYAFPAPNYLLNGSVIHWCEPQRIGVYALAYLVKEWRKDAGGKFQLVGYTCVDLEVVVGPPVNVAEHKGDFEIRHVRDMGYFTVNSPGAYRGQVELLDLNGKCVRSWPLRGGEEMSTSGLPSGLYLVKISGTDYSCVRRIAF